MLKPKTDVSYSLVDCNDDPWVELGKFVGFTGYPGESILQLYQRVGEGKVHKECSVILKLEELKHLSVQISFRLENAIKEDKAWREENNLDPREY